MSQIQAAAVVYAKDYLRIANFCKSIADFDVYEIEKNYVKLESKSFQLIVLQAPEHILEAINIPEPPLRREKTPVKLVFFVVSINKVREAMKMLGGALNTDDEIWHFEQHTVCDGYDPEGNVFQIRAMNR